MNIGWDIVVLVLVLVLVFGYKRVPRAGRALGESARGFRDGVLKRHDEAPKAPLEEHELDRVPLRKDEEV